MVIYVCVKPVLLRARARYFLLYSVLFLTVASLFSFCPEERFGEPFCISLRAHLAVVGAGPPPLHCAAAAGLNNIDAASRFHGVVVVPHYLGRSGNNLLQFFANRYIAQRLGFALLAPSAVGEFGSAVNIDSCPPGMRIPWAWLRAPLVFSGAERARLHNFAANPNANAIYSSGFWEEADLLTAAVAHAQLWNRSSEAHPWLPRTLRDATASFFGSRGSSHGGATPWPPDSHPLVHDPDGTLVVHVRLDDLAVFSLEQAYLRRMGPPPLPGSHASARLATEWAHHIDGPLPPEFSQALAAAATAGELSAFAARYQLEDLLQLLERDVTTNFFTALPLSFYRAVIRGSAAARGGVWRNVLLVTDALSKKHPLVLALVEEFGAIVQSEGVVEDMATLLAARELVAASSTFSFMAALLGRAHTVHWPHAGTGSLRPFQDIKSSCLVPTVPALSHRFIVHDALRAGVEILLKSRSPAVARMQRAHAWGANEVDACVSRHPRGPFFLTPAALLAFYKDPACARVFMPQALTAEGGRAPLHRRL